MAAILGVSIVMVFVFSNQCPLSSLGLYHRNKSGKLKDKKKKKKKKKKQEMQSNSTLTIYVQFSPVIL